jgi:hypothetical protein
MNQRANIKMQSGKPKVKNIPSPLMGEGQGEGESLHFYLTF